jgi:hypothetical protein
MLFAALVLPLSAHAGMVPIASATAKSYYSQGGSSYPADRIKDGKTIPWFEGDSGNGVGAWIEVNLGGDKKVTKLEMFAGDWQSGENWKRANRPKELELRWADGTTDVWTLTDEWKVQTFVPKTPKVSSTIRFKVNSLYNGTTFPDTAISELIVYDDQPGAFATVREVKASTEAPSDADGSYVAAQASDGVKDTFWCEGNKASDGVGEWVEVLFDAPTPIKEVKVCTGMCTSDAFQRGNAPSKVTLQFSDGSVQHLDLKTVAPLPAPYPITPVTTSSVKVKIDAVRKGSEFNDACLSELTFVR